MRSFVLALAFLTAAAPALAQEAPAARDDFAGWARERIAQLESELGALKEKVGELAARGQQRFEEERPALEAAGESFWERLKDAAAALRDELRGLLDRPEEQRADRS
jgi:FtsZ-binding cell division protein ZapB